MSFQTIIDKVIDTITKPSGSYSAISSNELANEIAISILDLKDINSTISSHRGNIPIYPASVIKLFYLYATFKWIEEKKISLTLELLRALEDMIVHSSNDATSYVVDLLTDTTSGPELPELKMKEWIKKRNIVNEYFQNLGYSNLNICQKTWEDGTYGREKEFVGINKENRNLLTTNATARLLSDIVLGKAFNQEFTALAMNWLNRDITKISEDPDDQATAFCGKILFPSDKLWSKAGWTSQVRHDAAYIERIDGTRLIIVIFTENHSDMRMLIPKIANQILYFHSFDQAIR